MGQIRGLEVGAENSVIFHFSPPDLSGSRGRHKARTYTSYIVCIVYVLVIMYMYNMVNTFFILNFVLTSYM